MFWRYEAMAHINKWLARFTELMWFMVQQPDESIDHPLQDEYTVYS